MAQQLDHERLIVCQKSVSFVAWWAHLCDRLPRAVDASDHSTRACSGVVVTIAEGSGTRSLKSRCQLYDSAYGSSLECAACLDILEALGLITSDHVRDGKEQLVEIVSMLIGMRSDSEQRLLARESLEANGGYLSGERRQYFDHEELRVYRRSLDLVSWIDDFVGAAVLQPAMRRDLDKLATSVVLNIAEGNGKFASRDRCRFIGYSRNSALRIAATLDVLHAREGLPPEPMREAKTVIASVVRMLSAWENSLRDDA
ncbi:MAG: four helix bundle protein [Verrucomicrobia bacterium]|nr:four helix bundle protein [Verrucomicrobiota bacterium]MDA1086703.1 four helix bundle protein [Verrucomicrobiota bacterium]